MRQLWNWLHRDSSAAAAFAEAADARFVLCALAEAPAAIERVRRRVNTDAAAQNEGVDAARARIIVLANALETDLPGRADIAARAAIVRV